MSFNSFSFVIFFILVYLVNSIFVKITKRDNKYYKIYKVLILLESYAYIMVSDLKTTICLVVLTLISYAVYLLNKKYSADKKKVARITLIIGVTISVFQLGWFKYYDFVCDNIYSLLNMEYKSTVSYIPLGISFFTFSAISFMVDAYRGKNEEYANVLDVAVYLAFFPKFLSGPIVRPARFLNEMKQSSINMNYESLQKGIQMVAVGFFKKMVVADHLAIFVDDVFLSPKAFNSGTCIWAIISYSLQIYFDFSGYSDIAIGIAKMLGFNFDLNFNLPYISKNVTEFWKRWHISLSSWLQEYVYISLGGNRKGKIRQYVNLLLTMLIGGLWHGAAWTFIVWGGIHGIALIVHKRFLEYKKSNNKLSSNKLYANVLSSLSTFVFVTVVWVFFRASDVSNALMIIKRSVTMKSGVSQLYSWTWLAIIVIIIEIVLAINNKADNTVISVKYPELNLTKVGSLIVFFTFVGLIIILAYVGDTAFIYGKF